MEKEINIGQKTSINQPSSDKNVEEVELSILDLVSEGSVPAVHSTRVADSVLSYLKKNAN